MKLSRLGSLPGILLHGVVFLSGRLVRTSHLSPSTPTCTSITLTESSSISKRLLFFPLIVTLSEGIILLNSVFFWHEVTATANNIRTTSPNKPVFFIFFSLIPCRAQPLISLYLNKLINNGFTLVSRPSLFHAAKKRTFEQSFLVHVGSCFLISKRYKKSVILSHPLIEVFAVPLTPNE